MTTTIIEGEGGTDDVAGVAFAAGEATAAVEQLSEEVAEVQAEAATAQVQAEIAADMAAESVTTAQIMLERMDSIEARQAGIESGLILLAEKLDDALTAWAAAQEPAAPAEPPKKDSAPRRKSNAHKFLYGG